MLINKGMAEGDIITIKLTSGEELVAKLVEENAVSIKVSKPVVLTANQNGIAMVPYLFTVSQDRHISIAKGTVTVFEQTEAGAAKQFIQATTGIVT